MPAGESVKVVVRCRPLMEKEKQSKFKNIVHVDSTRNTIEIEGKGEKKGFTFDQVYGQDSQQAKIYEKAFKPLVQSTIDGYNGTIFAYGQTGTGKTHTMEGVRGDPVEKGVIPRSFDQIFSHIETCKGGDSGSIVTYLVRASYLEIYQEEIKDLLSKDVKKKLDLRENPDKGVYVKDLLSFVVKSTKEIEHVMRVGGSNRSVGRTNMNEHSSRSHAIFIVTIECQTTDPNDPTAKPSMHVGKLNMVDLAGSERQSKTGSTGQRLAEATKINLSLSTLGNVISSLVKKHDHIPYRDSKLTRLLQDSLGGNSKTVMVANVGPADYNYDETRNTLGYADRAKNIKNKPKINEDPKDAMLREFQNEIIKLKQQLAQRGGGPRSRKPRIADDGTEYYSDGDEETPLDDEDTSKLREQLEAEKENLLNDHNLHKSERERLLAEADAKISEIKLRQKTNTELKSKLARMEGKMLIGGIPLEERTVEQEKELQRKRNILSNVELEEGELKAEMGMVKDEYEFMSRKYGSVKEEVETKTKKLKKLFSRLQQFKAEIEDVAATHAEEKHELQNSQLELMQELKFYTLLADAFVPPEHRKRIENRAVFDENVQSWHLTPINNATNAKSLTRRPVSAYGKNKRPQSAYTKMAAQVNGNPRYRFDNILQVELDLPSRTTSDFMAGGSGMSRPNLEFDMGGGPTGERFDPEDIIEIEATPAIFSRSRSRVQSARTRQPVSSNGPQNSSTPAFPQSRGRQKR